MQIIFKYPFYFIFYQKKNEKKIKDIQCYFLEIFDTEPMLLVTQLECLESITSLLQKKRKINYYEKEKLVRTNINLKHRTKSLTRVASQTSSRKQLKK